MNIPKVHEYFRWKMTGENPEIIREIDRIIAENPDFQIPYYPEESDYIRRFSCSTNDFKIVADYSGLNFLQIRRIDILTFRQYLHDAVVWNCERTEQGREYLEKAWANSQTEPDRESLRAIFGGK